MTVFPKRVWTKKWMVFNDKEPVRKLGDKVWVYDPNFTEVNSWKVYPEKDWENVSSSDELMYYDWLQPTEFGTFEDGFEATYTFKDYDGTVLKTGKVKDWETPVAPADPTREPTAEYTYTFSWWSPAVGPIEKDTNFVATYEATPNNYTVTIWVNDESYGSVDISSVTVAYGTSIWAESNILSIWENVEVTATAETWYIFNTRWELPATVTGDLTVEAEFIEEPLSDYTVTLTTNNGGWSLTLNWDDIDPWTYIFATPWASITVDNATLTIWEDVIVATAWEWYHFVEWHDEDFGSLPATVTWDLTAEAEFMEDEETPPEDDPM